MRRKVIKGKRRMDLLKLVEMTPPPDRSLEATLYVLSATGTWSGGGVMCGLMCLSSLKLRQTIRRSDSEGGCMADLLKTGGRTV